MEKDQQCTDEYVKKVGELIQKLTKRNHRKNAIIFMEAANYIKKSTNPEDQEFHDLMFGMSKQQEAKAEKDPHNAIRLYDESIKYLGKCRWDDKISDQYSETKILKLKKEVDVSQKNNSKLRGLFFEIATEESKRGNEKTGKLYLGLYHLYNGLKDYPNNPVKVLKELDLSVKSFESSGQNQFKHKTTGLRYRLLAYFQPTYESTRLLLEKAIKEFEKANDKFGLNEAKGSIYYISALVEKDIAEKVGLFKKASEYYRRYKLFSKYHDAIGWSNLWEMHNPSLSLVEVITLARKAQNHFKRGNVPSGFHHSSGFLFLSKAIKDGCIQGKKGKFVENLAKANFHFVRCRQSRYINLTAGAILLIEASKLPDNKSKELYKKSAEILRTINEEIYHLALYKYYKIEAYEHFENDVHRTDCERKAIEHIEAWLESLGNSQKQKQAISFGLNEDSIKTFYIAEAYWLKGKIEQNSSKRVKYLNSAIEQYNKIIRTNFWASRAWQAKGWIFMFLFEFDKAHEAFSTAYELNPKNKSIKKDIEFATDQLKMGFHDLKQMYKEESRFSRKLQKLLAGQISQPRHLLTADDQGQPGQEFHQLALSYIQKAGLAIEENYPGHIDKDEEGLRDEIIQCLKMFNIDVSAESKKAKGKRDIAIKDQFSDKELAAECLVWKGAQYYESKKKQLFDRYLTWHNVEAVLVTFVRRKNFVSILTAGEKAIQKLSNIVEGSFQDLSHRAYKLYISEHRHVSGITIRLYHLFFHLPNEN
jgi:tetratricopeptide (TPR) repeat protein